MDHHCTSQFTVDRKHGTGFVCERHLKSNPFRGEGFVHCATFLGRDFTWTTEEDDEHSTTE